MPRPHLPARWLLLVTLLLLLAGAGTGWLLWGQQRQPDDATPAPSTSLLRQEEIRFESRGNTLAGVLTLPAGAGPHPAVAFLNGSGDAGRTGKGAFPPLWQHFAGHGFACLSWDRPGVGQSTGDLDRQTFADRAAEALAAVRFLQARADIRRDRVGLWGFSQGGIVAPLAATQCADVAFLIEVGGCQTVAWRQDLHRVEAELRADGFPEAEVREATAFAGRRMDLIRSGRPFTELDQVQKAVRDRPWFGHVHYCDRARFESGTITVHFDPGPSWEKVRCPVLAIFGEKDSSCPVEQSVAVIRRGLERAGNRDLTIKIFPRADHGLRVSETGGPREGRERSRRQQGRGPDYVPGYVELMSGWLVERFGTAHGP
jgi:pimeloyl-ACP methyl ester carboxylesterase